MRFSRANVALDQIGRFTSPMEMVLRHRPEKPSLVVDDVWTFMDLDDGDSPHLSFAGIEKADRPEVKLIFANGQAPVVAPPALQLTFDDTTSKWRGELLRPGLRYPPTGFQVAFRPNGLLSQWTDVIPFSRRNSRFPPPLKASVTSLSFGRPNCAGGYSILLFNSIEGVEMIRATTKEIPAPDGSVKVVHTTDIRLERDKRSYLVSGVNSDSPRVDVELMLMKGDWRGESFTQRITWSVSNGAGRGGGGWLGHDPKPW